MLNLKAVDKIVDNYLKGLAKDAKDLIKEEIPVDSGNLKKSVTFVKRSKEVYVAGHDTSKTQVGVKYGPYNYGQTIVRDYGSIVYFGHGIIRPKKEGGILRFINKQGDVIYTKQVRAVNPNKFIDRAEIRLKLKHKLK